MENEGKNGDFGFNDFLVNSLNSFVVNAEDTGSKWDQTIDSLEKGCKDYKDIVLKNQRTMLETAGWDARLLDGADEFYDNAVAFSANIQKWGAAIAMTTSVGAAKAAIDWLAKK